MKFESKHNAHEKLHEENVGFEALEERCEVPFCVAGGYGNKCAMPPIHLSGLFCTVCKGTYPFVGNALQAVQRHLSICQKRIARCAKVPIQLLEAHCMLCKGTYPIVGSTLQAVQRYLSNCQKSIANCRSRSHYAVNQEIKGGNSRKCYTIL